MFDAIAIQIDGPQAGDRKITLRWIFTDTGAEHLLTLEHGVLTHRRKTTTGPVDATVKIERSALNEIAAKTADIGELFNSGRLSVDGDAMKLGELLGLMDPPDPGFAIVTP